LGKLCRIMGERKKALECYEKSLNIANSLHRGKPHPETSDCYNSLGALYRGAQQLDIAQKYYEKSLHMDRLIYKTAPHSNIIASLLNLGELYIQMKRNDLAIQHMNEALSMLYKLHHPNHPKITNLLRQLEAITPSASLPQPRSTQENTEYSKGTPTLLSDSVATPTADRSNSELAQQRILLKSKYKIPLSDSSPEAELKLFRCAAAEGMLEVIKDSVQKRSIPLNTQDNNPRNQKTALHWATLKQHQPVVRCLLTHGARWDIVDAQNKLAWEYALDQPGLIDEFTQTILKRYNMIGSSQISSSLGQLLRKASAKGSLIDIRYCCEVLNITIDEQDVNPTSRKTALHWAVIKGHISIVGYLVTRYARVDIADSQGKTALDYAEAHPQYRESLLAALSMVIITNSTEYSQRGLKP
jgi:tetratricopeptide (TPR) repeat protein